MSLFASFDKADPTTEIKFLEQSHILIFSAAQHGYSVLKSEVDVDTPRAVQPTVTDGQTHSIQHKSIKNLGLHGDTRIMRIGEERFWNTIKAELEAALEDASLAG